MYEMKYLPTAHQIILMDTEVKNGIHLTRLNNVGDGMARFLKNLVEQANAKEKDQTDANEK